MNIDDVNKYLSNSLDLPDIQINPILYDFIIEENIIHTFVDDMVALHKIQQTMGAARDYVRTNIESTDIRYLFSMINAFMPNHTGGLDEEWRQYYDDHWGCL